MCFVVNEKKNQASLSCYKHSVPTALKQIARIPCCAWLFGSQSPVAGSGIVEVKSGARFLLNLILNFSTR